MSFLKHRPHRKQIRGMFSAHGPGPTSAATTDDIPPPIDAYKVIRNLPRRPSDLTHSSRPRSSSTLRSVLSASTTEPNVTMSRPSITFTQSGVQPPVYVVTSLSNPPWETLELSVADEKTTAGDLVFTRQFDNVVEGTYQYKIRVGEGYWVVDESKETTTDDAGNRNNVINVKAVVEPPPPLYSSTDVDSTPTPFVVVDKVADKDHPEYGHVDQKSLREDATKRTADAEADLETVQPETSREEQAPPASPSVPIVVVERIDDNPTHGDDFGMDATSAQKVAHELRAADATPDKVIISPEPESKTPETEEQTESLCPHESFQPKTTTRVADVDPVPTKAVIEEEPAMSSTDQGSSQAGFDSPSEVSEVCEKDDEAVKESSDELDNVPRLPHEPGFLDNEYLGELDNEPLLSHKTGPFGYEESENVGDKEIVEDECDDPRFDSERAPTFQYENHQDDTGSEAPLLPHERDSHEPSTENSEVFRMDDGEPTFDYETDTATAIRFFISRTGSNSGLPHRVPRTDEEDEDLQDPLLEQFPTNLDQILDRVSTIGSHLPTDETREYEFPHSPGFSVPSQACSSVDLKPVASYTSLKPVDEEDVNDSDAEKPTADDLLSTQAKLINSSESGGANGTTPPKPARSIETNNIQSTGSRSPFTNEAQSCQRNDGADNGCRSKVASVVASPANMLNPLTPPLTPERKVSNNSDETEDTSGITSPQTGPTELQDGGRKQASGAVLVVGIAVAAYYYLYGAKG